MLLTGTFDRSLDEKLRLAIPKRIRDALGQPSGAIYVAPGTDGSLVLYPEGAFEQLAARLAAASPTQHDVRAFGRLFYGQAERVEPDRQGRIRLPARLAEAAGIRREAVLVGVGDHLELWDRQRLDAYLSEKTPQYDQIAEAAFGTRGSIPSQ